MTKNLIFIVFICLAIFNVHSQTTFEQEFSQFQANYGKKYTQHESRYRMQIYLKNKDMIQKHNADPTQTWKMDTTQFADLSQEEFVYTHLTLMTPNIQLTFEDLAQDLTAEKKKNLDAQQTPIVKAITPVNWTALGKMNPIRDQGTCGSCYAFAAVDAMQSANLIENNQAISLSEQQIVDCSGRQGNNGCNGGWPSNSFVYIINNNITTESSYPYSGKAGQCKGKGGNYRISSFKSPQGCANLINEVGNRPLAVEVDATKWTFYRSGVFNSCSSTIQVNHAVTLAGIDANANWWIKNSWGTRWGLKGYMVLKAGNTCGICKYPGYSPYF